MCCGAVLFMDSVLYVLWRGLVYGENAVCVVVWFCLRKMCCMCCGVVLFTDSVLYVSWCGFFTESVLYVLWCGFVYGQCAVYVVV